MQQPPRKSFVLIAAFAMTLLVACAAASLWLVVDAKYQSAEAKALEARKKAQVQVAADFYLGSLDRDVEMMVATTSEDEEQALRAYFGDAQALGIVYDRQWSGSELLATSSGAWGETMRYQFDANGGRRKAVVGIVVYVPVEGGEDAVLSQTTARLKLEKGRWVVTGLGGKTIEEMY